MPASTKSPVSRKTKSGWCTAKETRRLIMGALILLLLRAEIQKQSSVGDHAIAGLQAAGHLRPAFPIGRGRDHAALEPPVAYCDEEITFPVFREQRRRRNFDTGRDFVQLD